MKLTSSRKRSSPPPRSPDARSTSTHSASSRQESFGLDSQDDSTPKSGGTPTSRLKADLHAPRTRTLVKRTVSGVRSQVDRALHGGADGQLRMALEGGDEGGRLDSVLKGGTGEPTYALILDHLSATPASKETLDLMDRFGADLLHAAIGARDLPRLQAACQLFGQQLPKLVAQDAGRVFLAAARVDPRATESLLDHLPTMSWDALLGVRGGAALGSLWEHAVEPKAALSAEGRAQAAPTLLRVYSEVGPGVLNGLHHTNMRVQRFVHADQRQGSALLQPLAARLRARGGVVPWGTP